MAEEVQQGEPSSFPTLRQAVLDAVDSRALAEFYRQLLGFVWGQGDEPPPPGSADDQQWLVIHHRSGWPRLAFQRAHSLPRPTWPDGGVAQQIHLDFTVTSVEELNSQHHRALSLGATLLEDRSDEPEEALRVYADPAGHPFCIFVVST